MVYPGPPAARITPVPDQLPTSNLIEPPDPPPPPAPTVSLPSAFTVPFTISDDAVTVTRPPPCPAPPLPDAPPPEPRCLASSSTPYRAFVTWLFAPALPTPP